MNSNDLPTIEELLAQNTDLKNQNKILIKAIETLQDNNEAIIEKEILKRSFDLEKQLNNLSYVINQLGLNNDTLISDNSRLLSQLLELSQECLNSYNVLCSDFIIQGPSHASTPLLGAESLKTHGFLPFVITAEKNIKLLKKPK